MTSPARPATIRYVTIPLITILSITLVSLYVAWNKKNSEDTDE